MSELVLVTGGAGFIGSHACDELLRRGYRVRALDSLVPQVHGPERARPSYLSDEVQLIAGDVRDPEALAGALDGVSAVLHLAAAVGVGQSMYEIDSYSDVNLGGTSRLLQRISRRPVRKLVVASSMSIYGEGRYRTSGGKIVDEATRQPARLRRGDWETVDRHGRPLEPVATPEEKRPDVASVYALTKYAQERMSLLTGRAHGISTIAFRFFNVYGPRQALANPYTGVLANFGVRLLNGKPPLIFEDGRQLRDFVHVRDVAEVCCAALEAPPELDGVYNIGSGRNVSILDVAKRLQRVMGREDLRPLLTGRYRTGDVRHCFADISLAASRLNFRPRVGFEAGIQELAQWLGSQSAADHVDDAMMELAGRGLVA